MRILHIINNLTFGGAEKLLLDIIKHQKEEGYIVNILALNKKNAVYDQSDLPHGSKLLYSQENVSIYNPIHILKIRKHVSQYDIVHVHLFPSQYWAVVACRLLTGKKVRLVTTEHSTFNLRMRYPLVRRLERFIFSKYNKIVAISDATRNSLSQWLHGKFNDILTIENGIELRKFCDAVGYENRSLIHPGIGKRDVLLVMIGRFSAAKDHMTLLHSMKDLPIYYKLILAGDGERKQEYFQFCVNNNLEERVIFLGFHKDIPRLLKSCDISIISSHWEGFGLAAVESMAAGIPVVASDVPGLKEVVSDAGLLFPASDPLRLVNAILKLEDIEIRKEVIRKQLIRASSFDIRQTAEMYLDLYRSLL